MQGKETTMVSHLVLKKRLRTQGSNQCDKLKILPLFLFTCCIKFVLSQSWLTLTEFIEKDNNIYNTKFILLNPP